MSNYGDLSNAICDTMKIIMKTEISIMQKKIKKIEDLLILTHMNLEIEKLSKITDSKLEKVVELMHELSDDERVEIMSDFCFHCGADVTSELCYCMRDE